MFRWRLPFAEAPVAKRRSHDNASNAIFDPGERSLFQAWMWLLGRIQAHPSRTSSLLAFCLPLGVYLLTLAPSIYNLDSAELTTAAATGGLTRATGYPLYLILGWFWSRLPLGDVGWRMNLFSAVCAALTIVLLDRVLIRMRVRGAGRFLALGLLTSSYYFWALALIAEVYTLQTALMAGILLALLRWREQPRPKHAAILGLLVGLALAHHGSTALMLPGLAWFWLRTVRAQKVSAPSWLAAGACLCLGLAVYAILPLRQAAEPAFNYAGRFNADGVWIPLALDSPQELLAYVSGRSFGTAMLGYSWRELPAEIAAFGLQWVQAFAGLGIPLGVWGFLCIWQRDRRLALALLLMFISHMVFYINYRVIDKQVMFLPAYLIWSLWLGIAGQDVIDRLRKSSTVARSDRRSLTLVALLLAVVPVLMLWNWKLVDQSDDWSTRRLGEQILAQAEPGALILGYWDVVPVVEYFQLVEGQRTDLLAVNRFLITRSDLYTLIQRQTPLRTVYIDDPPTDLPPGVEAHPDEPLYRLIWRGASP